MFAGRGTHFTENTLFENHSVNRFRNGQGATQNVWMEAKAVQSSPCPSGMSPGMSTGAARAGCRQGRAVVHGELWLLSWTNELVLLVPSSESSQWQN